MSPPKTHGPQALECHGHAVQVTCLRPADRRLQMKGKARSQNKCTASNCRAVRDRWCLFAHHGNHVPPLASSAIDYEANGAADDDSQGDDAHNDACAAASLTCLFRVSALHEGSSIHATGELCILTSHTSTTSS